MGEYAGAETSLHEVAAFAHTEHLCMYLAVHLRPDEKSPAIETESLAAAVSDKDAVFKSYPQEMLVLAESLLDEETAKKQSPIWWQNTSPWTDLYGSLSAYVVDHVSKHLIAVRQGLKDLIDPAAEMDVPVKMKEVTALISACVVGTQPGLRLVLELASCCHNVRCLQKAASTVNPFSKGGLSQRDLVSSLAKLRQASDTLHNHAAQILQTGFTDSDIKHMLEQSMALNDSASNITMKHGLAQLQLSTTTLTETMKKCPDPEVNEKGFMSFVRKHGPAMNTTSKEVEKHIAKLEKSMGLEPGKDAEDSQVKSAVDAARKEVKFVISLITMHTMLVLVRNPATRNEAAEERKWLASVYASTVDPAQSIVCYEKLLTEAREILGIAVREEGVSEGGPGESAEPAADGAPKRKARAASEALRQGRGAKRPKPAWWQ